MIDSITKVIHIYQAPIIDLGPDLDLCQSAIDSIKLSSNGEEGVYLWSTGSTDSLLWIQSVDLPLNQTLEVSLSVSNQCGSDSDTVLISSSGELLVDLGRDTSICEDSLVLNPNVINSNATTQYVWSGGDSTKSTVVFSKG